MQGAGEFLSDLWRKHGDLLEIIDFVETIGRGVEPEIGIHQAMDMTPPGLVSQQSIAEGGRWLDVPDFRDWQAGAHSSARHRQSESGRPVVVRVSTTRVSPGGEAGGAHPQ